MARKDKNYKVDEVIRALSSKGCVITKDSPITKTVNDVEYPSQDEVLGRYEKFLKRQNSVDVMKDVVLMGEELAREKWYVIFREKNQKFLSPRHIKREITVVPPNTINISEAYELGNGSWGKIDFLTNYCHFTVSKESMI